MSTQEGVEIRGGLDVFAKGDAPITGGVTMMEPYYKRDGTRQLVFANADNYYYIENQGDAWNLIGNYGLETPNPTAFQYKDLLLFGTGLQANDTKKWDGAVFSDVTTPPVSNFDVGFYTQYSGQDIRYVVAAGLDRDQDDESSTTLFFTTDPDDWSLGGVLQVGPDDGLNITGLVQNNQLVAYKERARHYFQSFYLENSDTFALRNFGIENSSGAPNHQGLVVIDGDVVSPTFKGGSIEGFGLEGTATGNARPRQYGTNINPVLDELNWRRDVIKKLRGEVFRRKVFYAAPIGAATVNNSLLVGDWDTPTINRQPSWTVWQRSIGSMAVFRDENGEDQFLLGDAIQPIIYRFNPNSYSDGTLDADGNPTTRGYLRRWRSKRFSLYRREDYSDAYRVLIAGFMANITKFKLIVDVDGKTYEWLIDKDQIVANESPITFTIGDKLIGDEVIGGGGTGLNKYRYLAIAELPNSLRYCKHISVQIENDGPGQFWSLDYLSINEKINYKNIPANHKNLKPFS